MNREIAGNAFVTSGDIAFILLFIVLPTAIIVSGFWAILFVLRRPAGGAVPRPSTSQQDQADPILETDAATVPAGDIASTASELDREVAAVAAQDDQLALDELDSVAADLLADELISVAANPVDAAASDLDDETPMEISPTEEIPEIADPQLIDLEDTGTGTADAEEEAEPAGNIVQFGSWRRDETNAIELSDSQSTADIGDSEVDAADSDQTIELSDLTDSPRQPADGPVDEVSEADVVVPQPVEDAQDQRGQQPETDQPKRALLVPSHAGERKNRRNARTAGRQVPQISRSTRRDEPVVKRSDGVSDI